MVGWRLHTTHWGCCYTDILKARQHTHTPTYLCSNVIAGICVCALWAYSLTRNHSCFPHTLDFCTETQHRIWLTERENHTFIMRTPHFKAYLSVRTHIRTIKAEVHCRHHSESSWPHTHTHTFLQGFVTNKPPCSVCSGESSPSGAQRSFSRINHANLSRTLINHLRLGAQGVFVCMCTETCMVKFCPAWTCFLCLCRCVRIAFYMWGCEKSVGVCVNKADERDSAPLWKQQDQCRFWTNDQ